jgi:uncharacterized protein YegJ (DUF2314 family)
MFMMNRLTRTEKRSLALGTMLFLAGASGMLSFLQDDSQGADRERRQRSRQEVKQTAGVDANQQQFEEKMDAAMDAAFAKLDDFIAVVAKPRPTQQEFAVKFLIEEGDEGEYLWMNEVKHEGKAFSGKLANVPQVTKKHKMGDPLKIKEDDVVDWMYVEGGKLKGGYTIRAQREMLTGEARKKFDEQFKFKFE